VQKGCVDPRLTSVNTPDAIWIHIKDMANDESWKPCGNWQWKLNWPDISQRQKKVAQQRLSLSRMSAQGTPLIVRATQHRELEEMGVVGSFDEYCKIEERMRICSFVPQQRFRRV